MYLSIHTEIQTINRLSLLLRDLWHRTYKKIPGSKRAPSPKRKGPSGREREELGIIHSKPGVVNWGNWPLWNPRGTYREGMRGPALIWAKYMSFSKGPCPSVPGQPSRAALWPVVPPCSVICRWKDPPRPSPPSQSWPIQQGVCLHLVQCIVSSNRWVCMFRWIFHAQGYISLTYSP